MNPRRLLLATTATVLGACAPMATIQPPAPELALPSPLATSQINMPIDAIRVAAAIVDHLQGGSGLAAGVLFSTSAGKTLDRSEAVPTGFDWRDTTLLQYATRNTSTAGRIAAGRLKFSDTFGRQAALLFTVEYVTAVEPIEVVNIQIATAYALEPAVTAYVMNATDLPATGSEKLRSHAGLLDLAAEHGQLLWEAVGEDERMVLVFLLEQVSPSADFVAGVSTNRFGLSLFSDETRYINSGGFRAALIPGRFDPVETNVFVKVLFRPGQELDETERRSRMIGVFPLSQTLGKDG